MQLPAFAAVFVSIWFLPPQEQPATKPLPAAAQTPAPPATEAERIARVRQNVASGLAGIAALEKRLNDPEGEYAVAEAEFGKLDKELRDVRAAVAKLKTDKNEAEAAKKEADLKPLEDKWQQARERFNVAIAQRKAAQEALAALKERVGVEQKELDKLEGKGTAPPTVPVGSVTAPTAAAAAAATPTTPAASSAPNAERPANPVAVPGLPVQPSPAAGKPTPEKEDPAVKKAREELEARLESLREAERKAETATERVQALERTIQASNKVLDAERMAAEQARQALSRLTEAMCEAEPAEQQQLAKRADEATARLTESQTRIDRVTTRLATLNEELHALREEQVAAMREAQARQDDANQAGDALAQMANPFTTRNIARWVADHGPKMLGILVAVLALYLLVRQFARQIVRFMVRHSSRGTDDDRENRANTLVGVFRYAASVLILGGGIVMLLDEAGVPVVPLMGGAAVLGLAVAFGAQNLIKDYFTGFMILLEDQYGVNDVVKIGSIAGLVEGITLRVTALRDLEGVLHFVPHGSITTVSNMTHTWSRALIDVPVPYDANLDQVIEALLQVGRDLRRDPLFGLKCIDDPEMLGVEAFDHSSVVVRFLLKTRPLQQWAVKREMLRRIKRRFDEMGVAIPFPHRTIVHKFPDGMPFDARDRTAAVAEDSPLRKWAA